MKSQTEIPSVTNYYLTDVVKPGTSLYYSLLYAPKLKRDALLTLVALERAISAIISECQDVGVARTKLYWWHDDIAKIATNTMLHPINKMLQPLVATYQLPIATLQKPIVTLLNSMQMRQFSDQRALIDYCENTQGCFMELSAKILSDCHETMLLAMRQIGVVLQLVRLLRNLRIDLQQNFVYLPEDECQRCHVHVDSLYQYKTSAELKELLAWQVSKIEQYYQEALVLLTPAEQKMQLCHLVYVKLKVLLAKEIAMDGYRVLEHKISLTPLRKCWHAWREQRRIRSK